MMCDECEEFPAQYVAYFNKAGGKLWRPAQKQATAWAIDIRSPETPAAPAAPVAARVFVCDDLAAAAPEARDENATRSTGQGEEVF
jgi:hypothetical protein